MLLNRRLSFFKNLFSRNIHDNRHVVDNHVNNKTDDILTCGTIFLILLKIINHDYKN